MRSEAKHSNRCLENRKDGPLSETISDEAGEAFARGYERLGTVQLRIAPRASTVGELARISSINSIS